jgi:hypothetical protein
MSVLQADLARAALRVAILTFGMSAAFDATSATLLNAPTSKPAASAPPRQDDARATPQAVGRIEALDMQQGRLTMNGTIYTFTPGALVVVNKATPGGTRQLATGQLVLLVATAAATPNEIAQAWIVGK